MLKCTTCDYVANEEQASAYHPSTSNSSNPSKDFKQLVSIIPDIESYIKHGDVSVYTGSNANGNLIVITPQGRQLNPVKMNKLDGFQHVDAKGDFFSKDFPVKQVLIDRSMIANSKSSAPSGLSIIEGDYLLAQAGDLCPSCAHHPTHPKSSPLQTHSAIEVGHTFYLGTKYSSSLDAEFKNKDGKKVPIQMGCFGLGVSRMLPAIVEASHDKDGIIWPESVAPQGKNIVETTNKVARKLAEKYGSDQVIVDDRDVSVGFKLKDSLLIGYPYSVIVGKEWLNSGKLEMAERRSRQTLLLNFDEL